jgi:multidrug efflux pump subunit AcrA (membrane-fusion protein)
MGDGSLWVAVLTALAAIAASLVTSRAYMKSAQAQAASARAQAETEAKARRVAELQQRRRDSYRSLIGCVSGFSKILWRMAEVDQSSAAAQREALVSAMQRDGRAALDAVEQATREVVVDGPEEVSRAAELLCFGAVLAHHHLCSLTDGLDPGRADYDRAYRDYRRSERAFLDLASKALADG